MDKKDCTKPSIRHIRSKDIPVFGEDVLPESAQLLMFVTEQDQNCGQYKPFIYRLPASFINPSTGGNPNMAALPANGATITIPDGQVRAGFVYNNTPHDIRLADTDDGTTPQFLIVGQNTSDSSLYDIVTDGIYKFGTAHEYVIGYTYYLGIMGQPTTENTGVPLFDVLDNYRIRVHIGA